MSNENIVSRRNFLTGSALAVAGSTIAGAQTIYAQPKPSELPDLRIKEVKVQVTKYKQIARVITESGIEGNYTLEKRYWHPDWSTDGWLEFAKNALIGKSALDRMKIITQYHPMLRRRGQSPWAATIDICLWDILGKAVGLPIYKLLGACKEKVLAYASTHHLKTVQEFVDLTKQCLEQGFKALKIHPPELPDGCDYKLDIEVCKAIRDTAGKDFILLHDPVGIYNRFEALEVGRVLDQLDYYGYEDPLPTNDIEGYTELCRNLDVPIHCGEFIFSIYTYSEYIRRGAVDILRFIVDNIGGITAGMKVVHTAECFGMKCEPHNWGDTLEQAAHFHCELAMFNGDFYEMTVPQGNQDIPYMKDQIRVAKDGYVYAPTKPGMGYEIDWNVLDNNTIEVKQ